MDFKLPSISGTRATFQGAVDDAIASLPATRMIRRVADRSVQMHHYHAILLTLFHQTRSSPYTFAQAGAQCGWTLEAAKEYLLQHAEEEREHWKWVRDDLISTGYAGESPEHTLPHPTCEAYIAFNERVAMQKPIARLAIASVLEGVAAAHANVVRDLLGVLRLTPKQASFFTSHGETDKVHAVEIMDVIAKCPLSPEDWGWMTHAAAMAGKLYCAMYDHEAFA